MLKVSCIIIEDEPLAVKVLESYISNVPFLELNAKFRDALSASDYLLRNPVDLIFLDIHLPKLKGMDFIRTLANPPAVIVTTAYHQYALEGYELNVTDYLLKPIEFSRFLSAVNKVAQSLLNKKSTPPSHLFITIQKKKIKIQFADILYIESKREYIRIVLEKKEYLVRMSTAEIESMLPPDKFRRIHRSFIVSLDKIDSFSAKTIEIRGSTLPIGREFSGVTEDF